MTYTGVARLVVLAAGIGLLGACEEGKKFSPFKGNGQKPAASAKASAEPTIVEREVEAPDVFQAQEDGLWDGRPSLGGIWVAHPDADDPERVVIRNLDNGRFVVGALFRRERDNPGPRLQVSSDAAAELGMLAGSPTQLSVVALIRETVEIMPEVETPVDPTTDTIDEATLDPVASIAAAAIDAAEAGGVKPEPRPEGGATTAAAATPAPAPAPAPPTGGLTKPYIQIGIFSVKANADQTADLLRNSGVVPTVKTFESNGKTYWRVIVGPVGTSADRSELIKKVKGLGFADAYPVSN